MPTAESSDVFRLLRLQVPKIVAIACDEAIVDARREPVPAVLIEGTSNTIPILLGDDDAALRALARAGTAPDDRAILLNALRALHAATPYGAWCVAPSDEAALTLGSPGVTTTRYAAGARDRIATLLPRVGRVSAARLAAAPGTRRGQRLWLSFSDEAHHELLALEWRTAQAFVRRQHHAPRTAAEERAERPYRAANARRWHAWSAALGLDADRLVELFQLLGFFFATLDLTDLDLRESPC